MDRKGKEKLDQPKNTCDNVQQGRQEQLKNWENPPDGWIKCNVDASFLMDEKNGASGVVLRDHSGIVLLSDWDIIIDCQSAAMGEAVACLEDLKLGLANCDSNLITETDCSSILESFKEDICDRSEVFFMAKEFNLLRPPAPARHILSKCSVNCNSVAHGLSQLSRSVLCGVVLQGALPTCVSKAALDDCNSNNVI